MELIVEERDLSLQFELIKFFQSSPKSYRFLFYFILVNLQVELTESKNLRTFFVQCVSLVKENLIFFNLYL